MANKKRYSPQVLQAINLQKVLISKDKKIAVYEEYGLKVVW